jgi:hypothetical protein
MPRISSASFATETRKGLRCDIVDGGKRAPKWFQENRAAAVTSVVAGFVQRRDWARQAFRRPTRLGHWTPPDGLVAGIFGLFGVFTGIPLKLLP